MTTTISKELSLMALRALVGMEVTKTADKIGAITLPPYPSKVTKVIFDFLIENNSKKDEIISTLDNLSYGFYKEDELGKQILSLLEQEYSSLARKYASFA